MSVASQQTGIDGQADLWCPFCSAPLQLAEAQPAGGPQQVICAQCGRSIDVASARSAAVRWTYAVELRRYVDGLRRDAAALTAQAVRFDPVLQQAEHDTAEAMSAARRCSGEPAAAVPAGPEQSPARAPFLTRVPMSVLLQGTGAGLLLAALVAASAVLWPQLGAALQLAALLLIVATTGVIASWTAKRLPTTGAVLSALTAGAGLTVAAAVPTVLPALSGRWYPVAAAALGTMVLLAAGRVLHDRIWWHTGIVGAGLTAAIGINAVLDLTGPALGPAERLAAAALLAVPVLAGAFAAADRVAGDPETARTVRWVGQAGLALAAVGAIGAALLDLSARADGMAAGADRWIPAAAVAAVAGLLAHRARRDRAAGGPGTYAASLAAGLFGALPLLLAAPAAPATLPTAVLGGLVPIVALAGLAWLAAGRRVAPGGGAVAPAGGVVAPGGGAVAPAGGVVAPGGGAVAPAGGVVAPGVGAVAPGGGAVAPGGGSVAPGGGADRVSSDRSAARPGATAGGPGATAGGAGATAGGPGATAGWPGAAPVGPAALSLAGLGAMLALAYAARGDDAWTWLVPAVWGLGGGSVALAYGLAVRTKPWIVAGAALATVTWTWLWLTDRLGDQVEWWTLPIGAVVLVGWAAARRRAMVARAGDPRVGQALVVLTLAPSVVLAWEQQAADGSAALWRTSLVLAGLAGVAGWSAAARSGWALPVSAASLVAAGHAWIALARTPDATIDAAFAVAALLVAAIAASLAADRLVSARRAARVAAGTPLLLWSLLVAATGVPTDRGASFRLLAVLAALALVAALAARAGRTAAAAAAATLVLLAWQQVLLAVLDLPDPAPELFTVPAVLAAVLIGLSVGPPSARPTIAVGGAGLALLLSSAVAITTGRLPAPGVGDPVRVGIVVFAWGALAVALRRRPVVAAAAGTAAVLVAAVNVVAVLLERWAEPMPELWTLPSAAALGTVSWLIWRTQGRRGPSLVWLGPPLSLALLPTAALAWSDPDAGWRVWAALIAGAVLLVAGVRRALAGLTLPGLAALVLVAAPVLLQLAGRAPLWVPLSIVGGLLLVIGARFEAARREGRRAVDWVLHLR